MQRIVLDSLVGVPVVISASNRDKVPFRPGSRFEFPVVLTHTGEHALDWSQEQPLNLSYRWLTPEGEDVDRDGRRTALPADRLIPGARLELDVAGVAPDEEGSYLLQVSLVLEGAHWACDMGSDGWTQLEALVAPAPAWPGELENSRGGRALRGAMAAAELARLVAKRTVAGRLSSGPAASTITAEPDNSSIATNVSEPVRQGWRAWLRGALGVRGLEDQLSDVIEIASRQEEQALSLEQQIVMLREELLGASSSSKGRAIQSNGKTPSPRDASKNNPR